MSAHEKLVASVSLVLRDKREFQSLSQSELARKSGLHRSYIGDLERGFRNLSLKNLSRLAAALDMPPSKVLALAEKKMAAEPRKAAQSKKKTAGKAAVRASVKSSAKPPAKPAAKKPVKAASKKSR